MIIKIQTLMAAVPFCLYKHITMRHILFAGKSSIFWGVYVKRKFTLCPNMNKTNAKKNITDEIRSDVKDLLNQTDEVDMSYS